MRVPLSVDVDGEPPGMIARRAGTADRPVGVAPVVVDVARPVVEQVAAALGLARSRLRWKGLLMALMISPLGSWVTRNLAVGLPLTLTKPRLPRTLARILST